MPWAILGRVLRGEPGPDAVGAVGAQEQHAAAALDLNVDPPEEAEDAAAADEPHFFTAPAVLPPGVTILAAGLGAHPDANNPDKYPYIIATSRFCLLAHFAVAPDHGTSFDDNPKKTRLVLVRNFRTAAGQITATADKVPRRASHLPGLRNIQCVGLLSLLSDDGLDTIIAELQVGRVSDPWAALLLCFRGGRWSRKQMDCPLPATGGEARGWVPHGAVSFNSTICWFDLSWGMLTCDLRQPQISVQSLRYHPLPGGHILDEATPDIHSRRCITVTRNDSRLRYVEIAIPAAGQAAPPTVTMWTWFIGDHGWEWFPNYSVSFELIWNDDSYAATGLPRGVVPVLTAVSPANHHVVYFALEQNIFGVDVPMHRVEHWAPYNLVNVPGPQPPASGRFLIPWTLPEEVAEAHGYNALAAYVPGQQLVLIAEEEPLDSESSDEVIEL